MFCPGDAGTQACSAGVCCAKNLAVCGGACSDPLKDKNNCGGCGQVCAGFCSDGKCCPLGQTNCGGTCVDLQKDIAHCGTCEKACVAPASDGVAQCVTAACAISARTCNVVRSAATNLAQYTSNLVPSGRVWTRDLRQRVSRVHDQRRRWIPTPPGRLRAQVGRSSPPPPKGGKWTWSPRLCRLPSGTCC